MEPLLALGPLDEPDARARGCSSRRRCFAFSRFLVRPTSRAGAGVPLDRSEGAGVAPRGVPGRPAGPALAGGHSGTAICPVPGSIRPCWISRSWPGRPPTCGFAPWLWPAAKGETADLVRLAGDPCHRRVLEGTAAALFVQQKRMRGTRLQRVRGPARRRRGDTRTDRQYGPEYRYSPSQLETYIACPFQFFCKYVLELEPVEEKDELDEDLTERGSRIHDILEELENRFEGDRSSPGSRFRDAGGRGRELRARSWPSRPIWTWALGDRAAALDPDDAPVPGAAKGLRAAGRNHVQTLQAGARFWRGGPELSGSGDRARGTGPSGSAGGSIASTWPRRPRGSRFRVIDYKSGSAPSSTDVKQGEMLQLPLYAMAVERLLFQNGAAGLFDLGYWSLKKDGFKPIAFGVVGRRPEGPRGARAGSGRGTAPRCLRGAVADAGCESFCEYRSVCRVGQVRRAEKHLERSLPELSVQCATAARQPAAAKSGGRSGGTMTERPRRADRLTDEQTRALEVKDQSVALAPGPVRQDHRPDRAVPRRDRRARGPPPPRAGRPDLHRQGGAGASAADPRAVSRAAGRRRGRRAVAVGAPRPRSGADRHLPRVCGRLLRAHAVELGIDPEFAILDEAIAASLRDQAVRTAIRRLLAERDPDLTLLATDYGLRQIREALGILLATRTAGDLDDWASSSPPNWSIAGRQVWEEQGRPAVLRGLSPSRAAVAICCRPRRRASEAPGAACRAARALPGWKPGPAPTPSSSEIRDLARWTTCARKGSGRRRKSRKPSRACSSPCGRGSMMRSRNSRSARRSPWNRPRTACGSIRLAAQARLEYEEIKSRRRGLDFDDLLVRTRDLLTGDRGPRTRLAGLCATRSSSSWSTSSRTPTGSRARSSGGWETAASSTAGCSWWATPSSRSTGSGRGAGHLRPLARRVPGTGPAEPDRELPERPRRDPLRQRPLRRLLLGRSAGTESGDEHRLVARRRDHPTRRP